MQNFIDHFRKIKQKCEQIESPKIANFLQKSR